MTKQEKALAKEKKLEFILGVIFLIPPFIAVFCYLFNWLYWVKYDWLENIYKLEEDYFAEVKSLPIPFPDATEYLGLMALAGSYLIKNSFRYFFTEEPKDEDSKSEA